ncbi:MAG: hypothetical protein K0R08_1113 [Solimicrobium sp.]|nr:hypothetical protein [Solimicrobium sp.]
MIQSRSLKSSSNRLVISDSAEMSLVELKVIQPLLEAAASIFYISKA